MLIKKKYFWKKRFDFIFSKKDILVYRNIFTENISLIYLPSIVTKLIEDKNNDINNKLEYLLIYGELIVYKTGKILIFIKNLKFKLEKKNKIFQKNIISINFKHNLMFNIGFFNKYFDLIPLCIN